MYTDVVIYKRERENIENIVNVIVNMYILFQIQSSFKETHATAAGEHRKWNSPFPLKKNILYLIILQYTRPITVAARAKA
jgi:hypothetical protein